MLDKAFAKHSRLDGLIIHSYQGWQYQHYGYRKRLEDHKYNIEHVQKKKLP